jgi:hypothetical protein
MTLTSTVARTVLAVLTVSLAASVAAPHAAAQMPEGQPEIRGAWEPETYLLQDGTRHAVRGRIVFTESDWLVLFFILDGDEPRRGSGEGGTYTLEGDRLALTHLFNLSGGEAMASFPETPLRIEARQTDGILEVTRVTVEGDRLTLYFPSGNSIEFRRTSG